MTPNHTTKQQRGRTKSAGKVGPNLSRAHANESAVTAQLEKTGTSLAHAVKRLANSTHAATSITIRPQSDAKIFKRSDLTKLNVFYSHVADAVQQHDL